MTAISIDTVYTFECSASFGSLSQERINHLFRDGRHASGFLELQLEEWFPNLTFEDGKGYDHIDENGVKYDAKCFTKGGSKFCPSVMVGAGRQVNEEALWEHATHMIYIFCDIVEFPTVRVVFKRGRDLTQYSKGSIPFRDRDLLFGV